MVMIKQFLIFYFTYIDDYFKFIYKEVQTRSVKLIKQ